MIGRAIKAAGMLVCLGWHSQLVAQDPTPYSESNASESRISEERNSVARVELAFSGPASKAVSRGIGDKVLYAVGAFLNLPELDKKVYLYGYRFPDLERERISLGEMLSQAAAENTYLAVVVPARPESLSTEGSSDRAPEDTYTAFGLRVSVSANDWGVFTDSDRIQETWSQFSQRNPVIVQAETDGWFAFSKPLAKTFIGTELEAKDFVTSQNLWGTTQMLNHGLSGN